MPVTLLFTQVWLWSVAAFALGSLITWLLFVRPLRRRLNEVAAQGLEYGYPRGSDDGAGRYADDAGLDFLPGTDGYDAVSTRTDVAVPARGGQEDGPGPVDDSPTRRNQPVQPTGPAATPTAPAEPEGERAAEPQWPGAGSAPPQRGAPDGGARPVTAPPPGGEDASGGAAAEPDELRLSDQLRSLFEYLDSPESGQQPARPAPNAQPKPPGGPQADRQGRPVPPIPGSAPRARPETGGQPDPAEMTAELPRRTPGRAAHPGTVNAGKRTEAWHVDVDPSVGRPPAPGPEAGPQGGTGYAIKGHFASRQYHTPDSPHYDRIVAEVWFRTPADAEQAGFEPWNSRDPS